MRVLLDECVPQALGQHLTGHRALSVREVGWLGIKNGALLRLAQENFDAFVTVDRGLAHQQNVVAYDLAFVVLVAPNNKTPTLLPLVPELLKTLNEAQAGTVRFVR